MPPLGKAAPIRPGVIMVATPGLAHFLSVESNVQHCELVTPAVEVLLPYTNDQASRQHSHREGKRKTQHLACNYL